MVYHNWQSVFNSKWKPTSFTVTISSPSSRSYRLSNGVWHEQHRRKCSHVAPSCLYEEARHILLSFEDLTTNEVVAQMPNVGTPYNVLWGRGRELPFGNVRYRIYDGWNRCWSCEVLSATQQDTNRVRLATLSGGPLLRSSLWRIHTLDELFLRTQILHPPEHVFPLSLE